MYEQPERKDVILLHGWGRSKAQVEPLAALLAPYYRTHPLNLPGFGGTPAPAEVWDSVDYAKFIVAYMDENKIDRAHIFGHSFGGRCALSLATYFPDRVDKVVAASASGLKPHRTKPQQLKQAAIRLAGRSLRLVDSLFNTHTFDETFAPKFGSSDYKNAGDMRAILVKAVTQEIAELYRIQAQTLLVWGEEDDQMPLECGRRMASAIPNATLLSLPHKGHDLFLSVGHHLLAYYILPFLDAECRC